MERVSTVAQRLKEYRLKKELTLSQMEILTGIPAQTLNRYELGQRAPKVDIAVQLAERLSVSPLWLQGFNVPMIEKEPTAISDDELSDIDKKLIELLRQVPEEQRRLVLGMIEAALKSQGLL